MACTANFDLFMESKANDFHSSTHEHVFNHNILEGKGDVERKTHR